MFTEDQLIELIPNLRKYARKLRRRQEDVDDLIQETLARALIKRDMFVDMGAESLLRWLGVMMHNLSVNGTRAWGRESQVLASWPTPENGRPWDGGAAPVSTDARVVVSDMARALASLSLKQQEAIQLVSVDGYSYDEAAAIASVPTGTIRSRISRGRVELARRFER